MALEATEAALMFVCATGGVRFSFLVHGSGYVISPMALDSSTGRSAQPQNNAPASYLGSALLARPRSGFWGIPKKGGAFYAVWFAVAQQSVHPLGPYKGLVPLV